ncbi:Beta-galactosidase 15 [Acorus gramineus]|uniref:Beta-galactosidase n=1 Tax=Acorus gramineus TaxID=55184 RepID=A0AAV9BWT5_ACOGR|nr:Beta-galactosidase 15 [Acorus gramineus]
MVLRVCFRVLVLALLCLPFCYAYTVTHDGKAIVIDGQRKLLISGSIHYPRSTPEMWPELIRKAKEGGLNAIETYVFWNAHEPNRRQYNFEGRFDLVRFLKTIQEEGLYSILRIGPYVCAEWNYGGLPVWLHQLPGIALRTDNQVFENEMANFTTLIVNMIKQEGLLAPQGGPIIIAQIENEYGDVEGPYGDSGKRYVQWCANLAESFNIGVPWIMCQQGDAPQPMIDTCNGFYCDGFSPNNASSPKMWTENWVASFKNWGGNHPHRPAQDLAFSVARFYQREGTFQNYYMYHGGTNFDRTAGGPLVATSYDYEAPLDEYGNLNQPKWGHLKELHEALIAMENALLYGDANHTDHGNNSTNYSANGVAPGCFLSNIDAQKDYNLSFNGNTYFLPAWSVSVLPDCKTEAHNTAKINVQTSLMVRLPNKAESEPSDLSWSWTPEMIGDVLQGNGGHFKTNQLKEQLSVTIDASDYLWYMTKTTFKAPIGDEAVVLDLNGMGKGAAWVNGKGIGRFWLIESSPMADNGCAPCSYNGSFYADKCDSNCGKSTERWYHVPRSFLQDDDNTLVLFEEAGGDPLQVSFQTVTTGTVCADLEEGHTMNLACQGGHTIGSVGFACFGDPQGTCGGFSEGTCNGVDALAIVEEVMHETLGEIHVQRFIMNARLVFDVVVLIRLVLGRQSVRLMLMR